MWSHWPECATHVFHHMYASISTKLIASYTGLTPSMPFTYINSFRALELGDSLFDSTDAVTQGLTCLCKDYAAKMAKHLFRKVPQFSPLQAYETVTVHIALVTHTCHPSLYCIPPLPPPPLPLSPSPSYPPLPSLTLGFEEVTEQARKAIR